eukprot:scaffold38294_cov59-Phaeocystis_antarctica.AAC.3
MSRGGEGWQGSWLAGSGLVIETQTARCTPCHNQHLVPNLKDTGAPCRSLGVRATRVVLYREDPGGAPAAQTPSALGRPARSAACRSSENVVVDRRRGGC